MIYAAILIVALSISFLATIWFISQNEDDGDLRHYEKKYKEKKKEPSEEKEKQ